MFIMVSIFQILTNLAQLWSPFTPLILNIPLRVSNLWWLPKPRELLADAWMCSRCLRSHPAGRMAGYRGEVWRSRPEPAVSGAARRFESHPKKLVPPVCDEGGPELALPWMLCKANPVQRCYIRRDDSLKHKTGPIICCTEPLKAF